MPACPCHLGSHKRSQSLFAVRDAAPVDFSRASFLMKGPFWAAASAIESPQFSQAPGATAFAFELPGDFTCRRLEWR